MCFCHWYILMSFNPRTLQNPNEFKPKISSTNAWIIVQVILATDYQVTRFPDTTEGAFNNGSLMTETSSSTVSRNLTFLGNVEWLITHPVNDHLLQKLNTFADSHKQWFVNKIVPFSKPNSVFEFLEHQF